MERQNVFHWPLRMPRIYSAVQELLGGDTARRRIVSEILQVQGGERLLDIGCGPADILAHLPKIDYVGIDYSKRYIEKARSRFADRGVFLVADVSTLEQQRQEPFDLVCALGLLHHLDDDAAIKALRGARRALKPGGRFVALDPLIESPQHPVARGLALLDRGGFVRSLDGYRRLAMAAFTSVSVEPCRNLLRVPYSHSILRAWA